MVPSFLKSAEDRGWKVERLEHLIANKVIVGHLDGNHGSLYPRSSEFIDSGIKYISANALINGKVDLTKAKFLSIERGSQFKKGVAKSGDVLFAHNATVGPVGILETTDEFVIISTSLTYYRCNPSKIDNVYLSQFMASPSLIRQYERIMKQTTRNQIPITAQRDFYFVLPPLPEQQKIAKILSTWDKAISTTERLIENSIQQKKALMQQLLTGKKRLLDESGKRFEGESGKRFAGEWKEESVGSLGKIFSGGTPSTSNTEYWDGDINWITPTDITKQNSRYINSSLRKITREGLENSSAKLVPAGSLLICTRATIGAMAITSHEMCTNQGFKNIVPNSKTNIEFVYYLLTYNKHRMISKASGSTFLELSKTSFESMKFKIPAIEEQQKIATVLINADQEIELFEQQLADFQQEKKALMQVLLTGKKRVVVDGEEEE